MTDYTVTLIEGTLARLTGPLVDRECRIGRTGMTPESVKAEGDGATPMGRYPFRRLFYRADRLEEPVTRLPYRALSPEDGWCDDAASPHYNQWVRLPFGPSHEKLWRDDHAYDLIVVLGHNDSPPVPGRGSAIFLHVRHDDDRPTAGCVALLEKDLLFLLRQIRQSDHLVITR